MSPSRIARCWRGQDGRTIAQVPNRAVQQEFPFSALNPRNHTARERFRKAGDASANEMRGAAVPFWAAPHASSTTSPISKSTGGHSKPTFSVSRDVSVATTRNFLEGHCLWDAQACSGAHLGSPGSVMKQ